jgi:TRAP-type C4-dicarboxylate transport system substrate-binding protein
MKKLLVTLFTVCLVLSFLAATAGAKDKVIEWRGDTLLGANSGEAKLYQWFCDEVKKRSNGRLVITMYPGRALGIPVTELYRALKAGAVEMSLGFAEFQQGDAPALSIDSRFGLLPNRSLRWAIHKLIEPTRKRILEEEWNTVLLGGHLLFNTNCGIVSNIDGDSWKDFAGKKIRVSAKDSSRVYNLCGTSPVFMPLGETYQALKTGVIDGIDTSPRSVVERSLYEVAKNYNIVWYPGSVAWACEYYVSKKHWDKLPADLQAIVQEVATEATRKGDCIATDPRTEKVDLDKMKKNGMTIKWFSEENMHKAHMAAVRALSEYMSETKDKNCHLIFDQMKPYLPIDLALKE